jgi:hypothetical protein
MKFLNNKNRKKKLQGWKGKLLSIGSRVILLNSVLLSILIYCLYIDYLYKLYIQLINLENSFYGMVEILLRKNII